jgi:IclR family acetate operon transcriptional repressor
VVASVTRCTASSKASWETAEVACTPLTLRTYWRAAASISSAVAAGSRPRNVVMFRHMGPWSHGGSSAARAIDRGLSDRARPACDTGSVARNAPADDTTEEPRAERNPGRTQSVARSVQVLQYLEVHGDAGVTELGDHLGVSPSTAHRMARTLCDVGFVAQDSRTERYHLGPALIPLGRAAEARSGFDMLRGDLEDLAQATGESVSLGVRQGSTVLVVLRVASPHPLRFDQEPGSRVPIHASAMGKALLAFSAPGSGRPRRLEGFTDATITDPAALEAELDEVRRRGWALNDEERNAGVRAVAVPLLDERRSPLAAIAVQGPTLRMTDERVTELAATALGRAQQMARQLTGR